MSVNVLKISSPCTPKIYQSKERPTASTITTPTIIIIIHGLTRAIAPVWFTPKPTSVNHRRERVLCARGFGVKMGEQYACKKAFAPARVQYNHIIAILFIHPKQTLNNV